MDPLNEIRRLLRPTTAVVVSASAVLVIVVVAAVTLLGSGLAEPPPSSPPPTGTPSQPPTVSPPPSLGPTPTLPPTASPPPSAQPSASPGPFLPYAPLDGVAAAAELANRLPLAVMIDNNAHARPQAGFNRASIVYHAPNDGGTNRYMFLFQEQDAELVGPVRSTRLFFNGWALEYRPGFGHFGGDWKSIRQLREVNGWLVYDVDALHGSARAFWRDASKRAPFNAYTDTARLRVQAEANGGPALMSADLATRPFADDLLPGERPSRATVTIPYRGYPVRYDYDHATNSYLRSVRGEAQFDALDDSRVTARNVIVQFMPVIYDPTQRYNRAVMEFIGSGPALVFRDGLAIAGSWQKDGRGELTRFLDESGNEITLVRGRIFIQVVPLDADVSYEVGALP